MSTGRLSKSKMSTKNNVDTKEMWNIIKSKCRQVDCRKAKCRQERNVEYYKKKMSYDKFYL